jgi:hypothetical protein
MVSDRGDQGLFTVNMQYLSKKILFPFPLEIAKLVGEPNSQREL